ncbi:unnamed protein product, partial [Cyprideis torosa]
DVSPGLPQIPDYEFRYRYTTKYHWPDILDNETISHGSPLPEKSEGPFGFFSGISLNSSAQQVKECLLVTEISTQSRLSTSKRNGRLTELLRNFLQRGGKSQQRRKISSRKLTRQGARIVVLGLAVRGRRISQKSTTVSFPILGNLGHPNQREERLRNSVIFNLASLT